MKPLTAAHKGKGIELVKLCSPNFPAFWQARVIGQQPGTYEQAQAFGYTPQEALARIKAKL